MLLLHIMVAIYVYIHSNFTEIRVKFSYTIQKVHLTILHLLSCI